MTRYTITAVTATQHTFTITAPSYQAAVRVGRDLVASNPYGYASIKITHAPPSQWWARWGTWPDFALAIGIGVAIATLALIGLSR